MLSPPTERRVWAAPEVVRLRSGLEPSAGLRMGAALLGGFDPEDIHPRGCGLVRHAGLRVGAAWLCGPGPSGTWLFVLRVARPRSLWDLLAPLLDRVLSSGGRSVFLVVDEISPSRSPGWLAGWASGRWGARSAALDSASRWRGPLVRGPRLVLLRWRAGRVNLQAVGDRSRITLWPVCSP